MRILEKTIMVNDQNTLVKIVNMNDEELLTTQQTATLLGINGGTVRDLVLRHGYRFVAGIGERTKKELRNQGIIPFKGKTPNLLPKETIQSLVKIVNTDEAWAVYNQLWVEAEKSLNPKPVSEVDVLTRAAHNIKELVDLLATKQQQLDVSSIDKTKRLDLYRAVYNATGGDEIGMQMMFKSIKNKYKVRRSMFVTNAQYAEVMNYIHTYKKKGK